MSDKPDAPQPLTLKRWSQRKLAAAKADAGKPPESPAPLKETQPPAASAPRALDAQRPPEPPTEVPVQLPALDSLTFDSDFTAFMQPKVDEATRRAALRKLFGDPAFNVMDGLDIYVGDYTQPDPMPAGMLEKLSAVYAMVDQSPGNRKPEDPPLADPAFDAGAHPTSPPGVVIPAAPATAPATTIEIESPASVDTEADSSSQSVPNERRR
ncbi:MAG TPA: DUF3306 domain-containing protein [Casimicrobiaceae bacterium]|nr:DUF3306 domain-containing protein [Casimicrobiaceae bacterium]